MYGEAPPGAHVDLTPKRLKELQTLEFSVEGNFSPVLEKINSELGTQLQPREGFHVTIISPTESKRLENLTDEQLQELQDINQQLQSGVGVEMKGIGYIDGSIAEGIRPADKEKKTAFISFSIPALQKFRESIGLPPKDFHITLGFNGGDIHMRTVGQDDKGKPIIGPIPKHADPAFDKYLDYMPQPNFGPLDGQERQKKQAP